MVPEKHLLYTTPLAMAAGWAFSFPIGGAVLVGGVLIDADHLIEFWHDRGFSLSVRDFLAFGNSGKNTRQFIVLHSLELMPLVLLAGYGAGCLAPAIGLVAGALFHMLLDYVNILKRFHCRWYSFLVFFATFRWFHRFRSDAIWAKIGPRQRVAAR